MTLIHVLHPHVLLLLFFIGFIYFGMYLLRDVSPIHNFPYTFLSPKKLLGKCLISDNCADLVLIFEADISV